MQMSNKIWKQELIFSNRRDFKVWFYSMDKFQWEDYVKVHKEISDKWNMTDYNDDGLDMTTER